MSAVKVLSIELKECKMEVISPSPEELARRERARKVYNKGLTRARRLNDGLNAAIRSGNTKRIKHWQKLMLPFYHVPYCEWVVSQHERNK